MERIPVSGPWITQKEIDYVTDAVTTAWYGNANVYNERFEKAFAEYVGVRYAVSLPSCTSAIHLSLLALGIGPGDEVIIPDLTWIASAAPIRYVGATPVFADVDQRTWCLTAEAVETCLTPRTRAILAVDLYGSMPDMESLRAVAERNDLPLIEDAAEAVGSEYGGCRAGSFGAMGVFSFHGSKTLTTGEGGMLVTDREDLYRRVLVLRDHGRPPGDKMFFNTEVAYKYKMSSMQAALGLAQLERIEDLVARKRQIFAWYARELADLDGVALNTEPAGTRNSYWMVTAVLDPHYGLRKDRLMQEMGEREVDCRPFFHPLSSLPAFENEVDAPRAREHNRVSYAISPYGINLPSGQNMDEAKVSYVCAQLREILAARGRVAASDAGILTASGR
ncbi:MAG: DegT/DnrJ/EryC1/StrS family aminotransferase [Gemmatimonadetes bacterium]|nr:DegT/DnrJ/EryC1/StrS family aminotransferase [Gemmatimonadota bacterium]